MVTLVSSKGKRIRCRLPLALCVRVNVFFSSGHTLKTSPNNPDLATSQVPKVCLSGSSTSLARRTLRTSVPIGMPRKHTSGCNSLFSNKGFLTMLSRDLIVSQGISITMLVQHFGQGISHLDKISLQRAYLQLEIPTSLL